MNLKLTQKLNEKQTVEVNFEGESLKDLILQAGVLLDFDGTCPFTAEGVTPEITLRTRVTKEGHKYTEFFERTSGATRPWGTHKEGNSYFLKDWEPKYVKS